MLTRRRLLASATFATLILTAGRSAWAQATPPAEATSFIVALGNDLVRIVNAPGGSSKRSQLQPLIERAVDIDGVGRFCLGRFARTATPQQLQEYLRLFHDVLVNNIAGKVGEFEGVTFKTTTTTQRDGDTLVGTLITRPNQQPNNVQWVVSQVGGQPKVIDVIAEGTSLRLTQRADYNSYMSRNNNNLDALIAAMRQQVAR